jgi:hypothetical protein
MRVRKAVVFTLMYRDCREKLSMQNYYNDTSLGGATFNVQNIRYIFIKNINIKG